jgi:hypothetical protein
VSTFDEIECASFGVEAERPAVMNHDAGGLSLHFDGRLSGTWALLLASIGEAVASCDNAANGHASRESTRPSLLKFSGKRLGEDKPATTGNVIAHSPAPSGHRAASRRFSV